MSDNGKNKNLYTTRVSGDDRERLDVYIQNSDASKSETLRDLIRLGLEAEEVGATPEELSDEIEDLSRELDSIEEKLDTCQQRKKGYSLGAWGAAAGVLLLVVGTGLLELIRPVLDLSWLRGYLVPAAGTILLGAAGLTILHGLGPAVERWVESIKEWFPVP